LVINEPTKYEDVFKYNKYVPAVAPPLLLIISFIFPEPARGYNFIQHDIVNELAEEVLEEELNFSIKQIDNFVSEIYKEERI
jgi:hypothetical protein